MPKHQVLFREGDRGRNFYVQLSGKSQLFLPNPERAAIKMQISDLVEKIEANQKIIKGIDSYKEVNVNQAIERQNMQRQTYRLEKESRELHEKLETLDELVPFLVYSGGMYFGELALIKKATRAGTIVTMTDCYFAVVNADAYERLMKKDSQTKMEENVAFLRQIPYLQNWKQKELTALLYCFHEKKIELKGQVIAREGAKAKKVYIVVKGEFEIVKTDTDKVFFNEQTGVVGVKEQKNDGKMLLSDNYLVREDDKALANQAPAVSGQLAYTGSEFAYSVQGYLRQHVNTNESFKTNHRSKYHQSSFKELKIGVIGSGMTFGDVDALR